MNRMELYECWAPPESAWSCWAKPVLFAEMALSHPIGTADASRAEAAAQAAPGTGEHAALVVELPGVEAVATGVALARRGYRPVPLFNASSGPAPILDVDLIKLELLRHAEALRSLSIAHDAPPAFLLDSERLGGSRIVVPGRFDNRWVVFPHDFPSGVFLLSHGIRSALLLQRHTARPAEDLAHVLRRWQEAGVALRHQDPDGPASASPLDVPRPSHFRAMWYRTLALMGFRRNSTGGFGSVVPIPSSSGGYG